MIYINIVFPLIANSNSQIALISFQNYSLNEKLINIYRIIIKDMFY